MMNTVYDVMQLLGKFGIYVYTGDRQADFILMESELKDLHELGLIMKEDYITAILVLKKASHLFESNE